MKTLAHGIVLMLLLLSGCSSRPVAEEALFRPWCWDNAKHARQCLGQSAQVFVARVDECAWEDLGPHRLTPWHYKATVVKSYKGDWTVGERVAFVHCVDAPAPTSSISKRPDGQLVFIFTNEHTNSEIGLDTGEWGAFREDMAPALDYLYPQRPR